MIYDTIGHAPEPGSVLESLLTLVSKRRQEAQVGAVRVLAESVLRPMKDSEKNLSEALTAYLNSMFPYLESKQDDTDKNAKAALKDWVGKGRLGVKPLWQAKKRRSLPLRSRLKEKVDATTKPRKKGTTTL